MANQIIFKLFNSSGEGFNLTITDNNFLFNDTWETDSGSGLELDVTRGESVEQSGGNVKCGYQGIAWITLTGASYSSAKSDTGNAIIRAGDFNPNDWQWERM